MNYVNLYKFLVKTALFSAKECLKGNLYCKNTIKSFKGRLIKITILNPIDLVNYFKNKDVTDVRHYKHVSNYFDWNIINWPPND